MSLLWIAAFAALCAAVLLLGFLLLGALRAQGLLAWRLDQLEATMPSRIGRSGLQLGKQAPDFTLPSVRGGEVSLHDFAGRRVLLVFVQAGCGPCHDIVPELNRLAGQGHPLQIVAINHARPEDARTWIQETNARFPVLVQEDWGVSKKYEAFATPFAFLIDEQGVVASKGIVSKRHHLGYLLSTAVNQPPPCDEPPATAAEGVGEKSSVSASAIAP